MERTHELPFRGLPREIRDMIWKHALTVDDVPFRTLSESEKPIFGSLGLPDLLSHLSRLTNTRCDPPHLRLFLTNKQVYAETSLVFYSSNEFTKDVMSLDDSKFNANIRYVTRRVRLETRLCQAEIQRSLPPLPNINLPFANHRLDMLTITMPSEPPSLPVHIKGENLAIAPSLAANIVDCMLKGFIKQIRLVYPTPTSFFTPIQFWTIRVLRKGKPAITGKVGHILNEAWWNTERGKYAEVLYKLQDVPTLGFVARFEDGTFMRLPSGNAVIVLSRIEDEPIKKHTVPRPRVCIVSSNSHSKRRLPWNPDIADPRPSKIPRLKLPVFLAFSDSRSHKMPQRAVQERFKGKSNQIRHLVNDRGPLLTQIPRETYRWQHHPSYDEQKTVVPDRSRDRTTNTKHWPFL